MPAPGSRRENKRLNVYTYRLLAHSERYEMGSCPGHPHPHHQDLVSHLRFFFFSKAKPSAICNIIYLLLHLNELKINSLLKHRILLSNSILETTGWMGPVIFLKAYDNRCAALK